MRNRNKYANKSCYRDTRENQNRLICARNPLYIFSYYSTTEAKFTFDPSDSYRFSVRIVCSYCTGINILLWTCISWKWSSPLSFCTLKNARYRNFCQNPIFSNDKELHDPQGVLARSFITSSSVKLTVYIKTNDRQFHLNTIKIVHKELQILMFFTT